VGLATSLCDAILKQFFPSPQNAIADNSEKYLLFSGLCKHSLNRVCMRTIRRFVNTSPVQKKLYALPTTSTLV
jgi:hypothetical protein